MGDLTGPLDVPSDHEPSGNEVPWSISTNQGLHLAMPDSISGEEWGITLSPDGAHLKNQKGDEAHGKHSVDRKKSTSKQSPTKLKTLLENFSPTPQPPEREKGSPQKITISEASLKKLVSEAKSIAKATSRSDVKSTKIAKSKEEDEKKSTGHLKDDSDMPTKDTCPICGNINTEGPKHVCKSCSNNQKNDKAKELKKRKLNKPATEGVPTGPKESTKQAKEGVADDKTSGHRSISFDSKEISATMFDGGNKRLQQPQRTLTDLGPGVFNSRSQEKKIEILAKDNIRPVGDTDTGVMKGDTPINAQQHQMENVNFGLSPSRECKQSSETTKMPQIKRSTTDSEIVSRPKRSNTDLKSNYDKDEEKGTGNIRSHEQHMLFKTKKKVSKSIGFKKSSPDSTSISSRTSSQETMNDGSGAGFGFKMERSKTTYGKMSFDGDKRSAVEGDASRLEDGNDKTTLITDTKNKKFLNSGRSHTTIGDGLAKKKKAKPESGQAKFTKRENSLKKKPEKKGDEGDKKVCCLEDETENVNTTTEVKGLNNTIPQTLYDCREDDADTSSSESEDEAASVSNDNVQLEAGERPPPPTKPEEDRPIVESTEVKTKHKVLKSDANSATSKQMVRTSSPKREFNDRVSNSGFSNYDSMPIDYDYRPQVDDEEDSFSPFLTDPQERMNAIERVDNAEADEDYSEGSYSVHASRGLDIIAEEGQEDEMKYSPDVWYYSEDPNPETPESNEPMDLYEGEVNKAYENETDETPYFEAVGQATTNTEDNVVIYTNHSPEIIENVQEAQRQMSPYFETDVDTGWPSPHSPTQERRQFQLRCEWGFPYTTDASDDSSSSDEESQSNNPDAWYTGDYFAKTTKSNTSAENDDLIYFNDRAAVKQSESDIYTGDINYRSVEPTGNDLSKNNNITLEENLFEGSNFWNVYSRPQMHPKKRRQHTRTDAMEIVQPLYPHLVGDECITEDILLWPFLNVSNNSTRDNGQDDDYLSPFVRTNANTMAPAKSDYTEYSPRLLSTISQVKPKKDLILLGNRDFSKYEAYQAEERASLCSNESSRIDVPFYGDKPQKQSVNQTKRLKPEQSLYFMSSKYIPANLSFDHSREALNTADEQMEDPYQGGFFYSTRMEKNNSCNSNNNADTENESYTGCFRNEEELKPTHDGLFNDKASSFVFQKRKIGNVNLTPSYFNISNTKSYYDNEDTSVYAFEKKMEHEKSIIPKQQVMKVGGIVVRNNVECEVDYAQNINMDMQASSWMRYSSGEGEAKDEDTSNYAQNVSFEEMTMSRPWVRDDSRHPWKMAKTQENGKKPPGAENTSSWTGAPTKVVKSVRTLGSYVTKWF